ncbi:hypothetical protein SDC9_192642 [bioreactor metagenome]|uniref:Uncharacterized protein n=1 Tax=bioreactor metagenome TaxID=1076179 RepID=A0A645I1C4_9ZZZZ
MHLLQVCGIQAHFRSETGDEGTGIRRSIILPERRVPELQHRMDEAVRQGGGERSIGGAYRQAAQGRAVRC